LDALQLGSVLPWKSQSNEKDISNKPTGSMVTKSSNRQVVAGVHELHHSLIVIIPFNICWSPSILNHTKGVVDLCWNGCFLYYMQQLINPFWLFGI